MVYFAGPICTGFTCTAFAGAGLFGTLIVFIAGTTCIPLLLPKIIAGVKENDGTAVAGYLIIIFLIFALFINLADQYPQLPERSIKLFTNDY